VALMLDREAAGREANPTGGVLDSQTVKAPFAEAQGYDGGKRIVGRSHRDARMTRPSIDSVIALRTYSAASRTWRRIATRYGAMR
jgi:hypothetical protein